MAVPTATSPPDSSLAEARTLPASTEAILPWGVVGARQEAMEVEAPQAVAPVRLVGQKEISRPDGSLDKAWAPPAGTEVATLWSAVAAQKGDDRARGQAGE